MPSVAPAAAAKDTESPPPLKLDDMFEAVVEMRNLCQRLVAAVLDPGGALDTMGRKVDAFAASNKVAVARLRDDLLVAVLSGGSVDAVSSPVSVLVVDDVSLVRDAVCRILEDAGVTVHSAGNGEEALSILASETPIDVVLSDIFMPGNGTTLLQHVREDHPRVEVVVMSGYEGQGASYALEHGAHGFLAKPFTADAALLAVTRAAQYRRLRTGRAATP